MADESDEEAALEAEVVCRATIQDGEEDGCEIGCKVSSILNTNEEDGMIQGYIGYTGATCCCYITGKPRQRPSQ